MMFNQTVTHLIQDNSGSTVVGETYLPGRTITCYAEPILSQASRETYGLDSNTDLLLLTLDGSLEIGDRIQYGREVYMVRGRALHNAVPLFTHHEYRLEMQ